MDDWVTDMTFVLTAILVNWTESVSSLKRASRASTSLSFDKRPLHDSYANLQHNAISFSQEKKRQNNNDS